ncbi:hypothetical protein Pcinc_034465 [Petrolisthes cinctipes]|uniref:C2H2-type domain-containing protein n=1 Tax=Petrolisthes cinctipes TaxID=88211 RepID=A0AAE1JZX7_PETCI|nr:hypothetical protein Pcinc_034465 [Petrolisthes cinctipes]
MVDVGGGARESFQSLCMEEPDAVLGAEKESCYSHPHHTPPPSSNWRHTMLGEGITIEEPVVECIPPDTLHIKNDPENLVSMCSSSDPGTEAVEDARARGRLLQEITRVAETFEPYGASPTPGYRSYDLPPEASAESEYIHTPNWLWNRNPVEDRGLGGPSSGSLLTGPGQQGDAGINSLPYGVASQLIPDAFSSLPPLSVAQTPASVPTCSSRGTPLPSVLDLSPGPHQLPLLQPTNVTPASTHMVTGSSQQLEVMQPSLMALDLASHHNLDESLMVVNEGETHQASQQCHEADIKGNSEEVPFPHDKQGDTIQASTNSHPKPTVQTLNRLFKCTQCDQAFSRAEKLKAHEQTHTGERPYKCDECDTTFLAKAMLIRHRRVHNGEKPYQCDVCETYFTESGSLKVHKRLHSGEKPFKCDKSAHTTDQDDDSSEHIRDKYICEDCDQTFFRRRQLKAHKKYCPCSCPSYQTVSTEKVQTVVASSLHSDPKEVDAMKLLSAALGVTGNDCSHEIDQHQHRQSHHSPPSPHHYPSPTPVSPHHYQCHSPLSPHQYPSPSSLSPHQFTSPSPHATTTTITTEKDEQHCQDLFTFTTSNSSTHQIQYNITRQENDQLQLPQQQLMHLPHLSTQMHDNIHQPSDHLQQLIQQQNALKQLSEDNILKLAEEHSQQQQTSHHYQQLSYIQQTDHHSSHYNYYTQSHNLPPEPLSQQQHDPSHHLTHHNVDLHQSSRECDDIQDHVQQNLRQLILPQESVKQQKHLTQTSRQHSQTLSEQPSVANSLSSLVQRPILETNQQQEPSHQHHLRIDSIEEQQFYKDTSLSLSGQQHFPHHNQSLHLDHGLPQSLPGDKDCDDLTTTLHHHCHTQNHQLQEELYQSEEDNQGEIKQHYHHHHHHSLLPHHHSQHFKVEDPYGVTVKNELVSHTYS